jgi:hypothetical protein
MRTDQKHWDRNDHQYGPDPTKYGVISKEGMNDNKNQPEQRRQKTAANEENSQAR